MSADRWNETTGRMHVLLYHAVVSRLPEGLRKRERKYWMDAADFRLHVKAFRNYRHKVLSLGAAWRAKTSAAIVSPLLRSWEPEPVILTFDDGWESDFFTTWPLLAAAGIPATFFVNTATLGKKGHLRWSHVRQMSDEGATFGSHGHQHIDLTQLRPQALETELRMSKDLLEGWVRKPVEFLSAPYGCVSRRVIEAAWAAGYRAVCTSAPRPAAAGAETIARIAIHAGTGAVALTRLIEGDWRPYWTRGARAALLAPAKRLWRPTAGNHVFSPEVVP
jgi:peptidoglycan/xylan/chitin deacetylase (PgdA/CDA1 family)